MANNQNPGAAFMPDLNQGPFSDFLDPRYAQAQAQQAQQGIQVPNPNGRVPKAAAAAAIIDKFLQGYQSGRTRSYLMQEQEQQKQVGLLQAKITQIANDPNRTDADKQAAIQPLYKAYGQIMGGAIEQGEQGQQDGKKGKKKNQGDQQPQGAGGHVLGLFKDFATGLAGGQFPKELDAKTVKDLVGHALVDSDTALAGKPTIPAMQGQVQGEVQKRLGALPPGTTAEQAAKALAPLQQYTTSFDPEGKWWKEQTQNWLAPYHPEPAPGSKEYYAQNPEKFKEFVTSLTGKPPTDEQAGRFFGFGPSSTAITWSPPVNGKTAKAMFPDDLAGNPTDETKQYRFKQVGGKDEGIMPAEGRAPTREQELKNAAEGWYKEQKGIEPDKTLTYTQAAEAQKGYKAFLTKQAADNPVYDIQAWDFITKGTFDVRGIGQQAGDAAQSITARAQQIMDENGLGPAEVIALRAGLKADISALARVTTQGAAVTQLEDQLSRNMDIARQLDANYKRGDVQFVNRIMNAFNTGTGDTEALNLAAQLHAVSREWAKLMQGQTSAAGVSIRESEETDKLLSAAMSNGQLASLFNNVIDKDKQTRTAAIQKTKRELLDNIRGVVPGATDKDKPEGEKKPKFGPGATGAALVNNVSGIKNPEGQFVSYNSPQESFQSTVRDLKAKMKGQSSTGLSGASSLDDLVNVWITGKSNGKPTGYTAKDVAGYLGKIGIPVKPDTPISSIPTSQLAAAISHFETGYDASPDDLNPYAQTPTPSATPPGAGGGVDLSHFDHR